MTSLCMKWQELFGPLPDKDDCVKLVPMDLDLKEEFEETCLKCTPCVVSKQDSEEIDRQIAENCATKLAEEYTGGLPQVLFAGSNSG